MGPEPAVARRGELRVGRRRESFQAVELTDAEKPAILRACLSDGRPKWVSSSEE
jgi:hypothetical protein